MTNVGWFNAWVGQRVNTIFHHYIWRGYKWVNVGGNKFTQETHISS
jgi:hypothetical protein